MDIRLSKSDAFIIILFFVIAIPVSFSGYDFNKGLLRPTLDTLVYCVSTFVVVYLTVYVFFPRFFPEKKIAQLFFWTILFMILVGTFEILSNALIQGTELVKYWRYELPFWAISNTSENSGILIGILLGKKFYDAQLDIQKREKEKRENELRLLKSQIDPHFLFNNLNAIDSLIDSDPTRAKIYLSKLSTLYRYLITTKDDEVVPLEDELHFAREYIYLLEQRFGEAYTFEIETRGKLDDSLIPPGVLQSLIENVVKHNQGDDQNPNKTMILISEKEIVVKNKLHVKNTERESFGIGLNNIIARYRLLTDHEVKISQDDEFKVVLPPIKHLS